MLRRTIGPQFTLARVRHVVVFLALAVVGSATIGATVGADAILVWQHADSYRTLWKFLWMGNATGVLAVAPLILAWTEPIPEGVSRRGRKEWISFFALTAIVSGLIVGHRSSGLAPRVLVVLVVPFLSWAALRLGPRAMGVGLLTIMALAIKNHLDGVGVLALNGVTPGSVLMAQAVVCGIVVTFLFITAWVAEWSALEQALRRANQPARVRLRVARAPHPAGGDPRLPRDGRDERLTAPSGSRSRRHQRAARQLLGADRGDRRRPRVGTDEPLGGSWLAFWQDLRSGCYHSARRWRVSPVSDTVPISC
jgi:hypothetical protein